MSTQKRTDILAAALRMVSQHGFHGTSMAMIAAEAHSGAGTIYNYFPSKDILMEDLFRMLKVEFLEVILANSASTIPFKERFLRMWKNTVDYVITYPEKMTYLQQYHYSPYFKEDTAVFTEAAFAPLVLQIEEAMDTHEIQRLPLAVFETLTIEVATSLARRHVQGEIILTDEIIQKTALACWHAIQPYETNI